jgi:hypothetical protein
VEDIEGEVWRGKPSPPGEAGTSNKRIPANQYIQSIDELMFNPENPRAGRDAGVLGVDAGVRNEQSCGHWQGGNVGIPTRMENSDGVGCRGEASLVRVRRRSRASGLAEGGN